MMLFRRVISHFRERRWADFLTELVVLVLGVFLGIQAANWNADRLDKQKGRLFVERLTEDLRKDLDARKALVSYCEAVIGSGERTIETPCSVRIARSTCASIRFQNESVGGWLTGGWIRG